MCTCSVANKLLHNITTMCNGPILNVVDEFKTVFENTCVNQCTVVKSNTNGGAVTVAIFTSLITIPILWLLDHGFRHMRVPAEEALKATLGLAWAREAHEQEQNQPLNRLKRFILRSEPEKFDEDEAAEAIKDALQQQLQLGKLYASLPYLYTVIVASACSLYIAMTSLQMGTARSELWLTTAVMAFMISEFINRPIKLVRTHRQISPSLCTHRAVSDAARVARLHITNAVPMMSYYARLIKEPQYRSQGVSGGVNIVCSEPWS